MKAVAFFSVLLTAVSGAAYAVVPTLSDLQGKVAFDGKDTLIAITNGAQPGGNNPQYTLHYSKNFGRDWQTVTEGGANPSDPLCVKWYTPHKIKPNLPASLSAVRYLGNEALGYQFYAVGLDGHVCRSHTGIDGWTLSSWGQNDPDHALRDITAGNVCDENGACKLRWVIVGRDGAIYTSDNPDTDSWHLRFTNRSEDFEHVVYGLSVGGPMFVAHTAGVYSQDIFYSSDAITWTKADLKDFNPVAILSGFVGLQYVPSKAMFVALNLSHVEIDKYEKLVPVVFSSRDGKNWSTGSIKPEIDLVSFDDIVYANNQKRFVTVGMKQTAEVIQTDTQNSADAITWAESKKPLSVPNSAFYSLAYSENRKRFVAAWLTTDTDGNNKPGGIATMEPTGEWVEAVMVPSCDGVPTLFSKPIIVTDPAGQEHFIVTPNYSEGCAYWATDPRNWYASSYSWK